MVPAFYVILEDGTRIERYNSLGWQHHILFKAWIIGFPFLSYTGSKSTDPGDGKSEIFIYGFSEDLSHMAQ
jgi:hypothetical protein